MFLFKRVQGCNGIAELSRKIVFWTHEFAVGLIDMGISESQDPYAQNCKWITELLFTLVFLIRFSWDFHKNWEQYTPFWKVFAHFWIGKGLLFGPWNKPKTRKHLMARHRKSPHSQRYLMVLDPLTPSPVHQFNPRVKIFSVSWSTALLL